MSAFLSPEPKLQFFNNSGQPLIGGLLYTYEAGTSTPSETFTSSSGDTLNTNPIILDGRGEANVWLGPSPYKFRLCDSSNAVIWTVDNVGTSDVLAVLARSTGSSLVGYQPPGQGWVSRTVQDKLRETVSVKDFGAVGDGVTNDGPAFTSALQAGAGTSVYVPQGIYLCGALSIPTGTCLYGDSPNSTIIQAIATLPNDVVFISNENTSGSTISDTGITLRNLSVNGQYLTDTARSKALISFSLASNLVIENCEILTSSYMGVYMLSCEHVDFTSCHFFSCGNHNLNSCVVRIDTSIVAPTILSRDISFIECSFENNLNTCLSLNCTTCSITNNVFIKNQGIAISLLGIGAKVSGNQISEQAVVSSETAPVDGIGISASGSTHSISGNSIYSTDGDCIAVQSNTNTINISSNSLINPGRADTAADPSPSACISVMNASTGNPVTALLAIGNLMQSEANAAFIDTWAAVYFKGPALALAPINTVISDSQMIWQNQGNTTWASGSAVYVTTGLNSPTQLFRNNQGSFDLVQQGGYSPAIYYTGECLDPYTFSVGPIISAAPFPYQMISGNIYCTPFIVRQQQLWTKVGVGMTLVVSSTTPVTVTYRIGIYTVFNGVPSTLVFDSGDLRISSTTTASYSIVETALGSCYLTAGTYSMCILASTGGGSSTTPTIIFVGATPSAAGLNIFGARTFSVSSNSFIPAGTLTSAFAYNPFPNTFPTTSLSFTSQPSPLFTLRYGV